ncbi:MAG TPA: ribbon-helix-helix domain-containing protein [Azospirillaceae bacterium]|nr:ribbon-helix-helix domain-containing protein [Azospirillaceae bacterium]
MAKLAPPLPGPPPDLGHEPSAAMAAALAVVAEAERLQPANIYIGGRRTSMRLDQQTWRELAWIAECEGLTIDELATSVAHHRDPGLSMTAALRTFIVGYLAARCRAPG